MLVIVSDFVPVLGIQEHLRFMHRILDNKESMMMKNNSSFLKS